MSQNSNSSPSLLGGLKRFSLQKNLPKLAASSHTASSEGSSSGSEIVVMSKKCLPLTSEECTPEDMSEEMDSKKEEDLLFLAEAFPTKDKMVLQDALKKCDWALEMAMVQLAAEEENGTEESESLLVRENGDAHLQEEEDCLRIIEEKKQRAESPVSLVIEVDDSSESGDSDIELVKEIIPRIYQNSRTSTTECKSEEVKEIVCKSESGNETARDSQTETKPVKKKTKTVDKIITPTVRKEKPSLDAYLKKEGVIKPKAVGGVDLEAILRSDVIVKGEKDCENVSDSEINCNNDLVVKRETKAPKQNVPTFNNEDSMDSTSSGKRRRTLSRTLRSKKIHTEVYEDEEEQDEAVEQDDMTYQDTRVYVDSDDDSDNEVSNIMTEDKRAVMDFLNTATAKDLLCMCSRKKADCIIELRPFSGWVDIVTKLRESKHLSTDLLNTAQDVLLARKEVRSLMKKCTKLAVKMEKRVSEGESQVTVQPSNINDELELAGYQLVGLNWLLVLHSHNVNGILADEMGLGKTVQVIALLAHLYNTGYTGPHLIVVPSSTLENWSIELQRWCPALRIVLYYGSPEERKWMRVCWFRDGMDDVDVILTTYSIVNNTPEERKMFRILPLKYVILDEAHMLKNMETQRYENLIRINAEHRVLLTGTPLQNSLLELMSLLIFVMPRMFSGKEEYIRTLFSKLPKKNSGPDDDMTQFEQEQVKQARRIMKPFVLRRLKKDVLKDLTEKMEETLFCPMSPLQESRYNELIERFTRNTQDEVCEASGLSGATMLTDLRKAANHTALLRYYYTDLEVLAEKLAADPTYKETNAEYIAEDLAILSDFAIHQLTLAYKCISEYSLPDSVILDSGKFRRLDEMLPELKSNGHRVLIFSQFVIMLDVLQAYLQIRDHSFLRLDGSTLVTARQELIDRFNEDNSIFVFLLSTRAGGLGINLTAADTVIIHDIDFNPYNDKQAEDRCHRVGQTKKVTVTRFISKNTIEEGMHRVALEKLQLERDINNPDAHRENTESEQMEQRSVVRLLKEALGLDSLQESFS